MGGLCRSLATFAIALSTLGWTSAAQAHPSPMITGGLTSQPIGHYEFCKRKPAECSVRSRDINPLPMSEELLARLERLTVKINRAVKPKSDLELYGVDEYWTYPVDAGDCEDYALAKRRILLTEGVSTSNLLLTVLKRPNGEGHAVLTVRTNSGDVILDNLTDAILNWDETQYLYLKRQSTTHSGRWVTIREGDTPLVGSLH
jgi:predicted transglutaminase-like cysteine proteinase